MKWNPQTLKGLRLRRQKGQTWEHLAKHYRLSAGHLRNMYAHAVRQSTAPLNAHDITTLLRVRKP